MFRYLNLTHRHSIFWLSVVFGWFFLPITAKQTSSDQLIRGHPPPEMGDKEGSDPPSPFARILREPSTIARKNLFRSSHRQCEILHAMFFPPVRNHLELFVKHVSHQTKYESLQFDCMIAFLYIRTKYHFFRWYPGLPPRIEWGRAGPCIHPLWRPLRTSLVLLLLLYWTLNPSSFTAKKTTTFKNIYFQIHIRCAH